MTGNPKPKIKASQIVADIRSGMDESHLKKKYGLCHNSVNQVLSKLAAADLLTEAEIRAWRNSRRHEDLPSSKEADRAIWRCPACNAPQPEEKDECPVCGVVVKKVLSRRDPSGYMPESGQTSSSQAQGWLAVIVSIIVFALAGTGLLWWSKHKSAEETELTVKSLKTRVPAGAHASRELYQASEGEPSDPSFEDTGTNPSGADLSRSAAQPWQPSPESYTLPGKQSTPKEEEPASTKYRTGVLRQFSSKDFKEEVVEASRTYPVVFQFFSNT